MSEERKYAIEVCREICDSFSKLGFSTAKNGLSTYRKIDKDLKQEIQFQITSHLEITIHFSVLSSKIKKWHKEEYQINNRGSLAGLGYQLGYITPKKKWLTWFIGKSDIAKKQFIDEASGLINSYLIPYFNQYSDLSTFIDELCQNGGRISQYIDFYWAPPISFVLIYGGKEKTQILFDNYIKANPAAKKNILKYKLHEKKIEQSSSFQGSIELLIAFNNGIVF